MADTFPLTHARSRLGELVSRARFTREHVVITEHGKPVAAIISMDELEQFQRLEDEADIAAADAAGATDGPKIPNHQAQVLLDVDDALFAELVAEFKVRGEAGIPDDEFMALVNSRGSARGA